LALCNRENEGLESPFIGFEEIPWKSVENIEQKCRDHLLAMGVGCRAR
jgi:hypothetical protein